MVSLIQSTQDFIGVSTETKPSAIAGSLFYETDTQVTYIYDGDSWVERKRVADFEQHAVSAFDEQIVVEPTTVAQIHFPYNINTRLVNIRGNNSGSVTFVDGKAVAATGATQTSAAYLISINFLSYRPGQGALFRAAGLFTTGVANSEQVIGIGDTSDGYFFGFDGASFGILRREAGSEEIRTITFTAAAGSGSGNITIELNGNSKTVAVALNDTVQEVATKVAAVDFSDVGNGWLAIAESDKVTFISFNSEVKVGNYSFTDTDTTGVAAAAGVVQEVAGASPIDNWIPQASWNIDTFDGNGLSEITLDPTKGNVYQIRYQWLGFGAIEFAIENPVSSSFTIVHRIQYANANTVASIRNPSLPICAAATKGAINDDIVVSLSSAVAFIEGKNKQHDSIWGITNSVTVGPTSDETAILTLKNKEVYQGQLNRNIAIIEQITGGQDSNKAATFRIRLNADLGGTPSFIDNSTNESTISIDKSATTASGGICLGVFSLSKSDSFLNAVRTVHPLALYPGDTLTISAKPVASATSDFVASVTWDEFA